ncbi:hypothetical protein AMECASPLE_005432 [Ameca splendens]|uniref:Secreted protein n=1 Tax=Ameca splendens TaxID=208324 RepID=A0ABV0Z881_9TELE
MWCEEWCRAVALSLFAFPSWFLCDRTSGWESASPALWKELAGTAGRLDTPNLSSTLSRRLCVRSQATRSLLDHSHQGGPAASPNPHHPLGVFLDVRLIFICAAFRIDIIDVPILPKQFVVLAS